MGQLAGAKDEIIRQLRKDILSLQGFRPSLISQNLHIGLGTIEMAFPNGIFPTGAIHEFISPGSEEAAATNGFISGIIGRLMQQKGTCLWIGTKRTLFPPALKLFGIEPDRVIFIDLPRPKEALWAIEEALKCDALSAVVGELRELSFNESRRLQLAVERSHVTGFIHRYNPKNENTVASIARWKIRPISSDKKDTPGVGFPKWDVQLLKVRNGKPGAWQVEWIEGGFLCIHKPVLSIPEIQIRQTG